MSKNFFGKERAVFFKVNQFFFIWKYIFGKKKYKILRLKDQKKRIKIQGKLRRFNIKHPPPHKHTFVFVFHARQASWPSRGFARTARRSHRGRPDGIFLTLAEKSRSSMKTRGQICRCGACKILKLLLNIDVTSAHTKLHAVEHSFHRKTGRAKKRCTTESKF